MGQSLDSLSSLDFFNKSKSHSLILHMPQDKELLRNSTRETGMWFASHLVYV